MAPIEPRYSPRSPYYLWTEQRVRRLTELSAERLSATMIAEAMAREFGEPLTRNAVIGKCLRLGIDRSANRKTPADGWKARKSRARQKPSPPARFAGALPGEGWGKGGAQATSRGREALSPPYPARLRRVGPLPRGERVEAALPKDDAAGPAAVDLMGLRACSCRWPVAGGFYCGEAKAEGSSYCPGHRVRAVQPGQKKSGDAAGLTRRAA